MDQVTEIIGWIWMDQVTEISVKSWMKSTSELWGCHGLKATQIHFYIHHALDIGWFAPNMAHGVISCMAMT